MSGNQKVSGWVFWNGDGRLVAWEISGPPKGD